MPLLGASRSMKTIPSGPSWLHSGAPQIAPQFSVLVKNRKGRYRGTGRESLSVGRSQDQTSLSQHEKNQSLLDNWRRRAVEVFLAISFLVYLPGFILEVLGYGPPFTPAMKVILWATYLSFVVAALLRGVDYRLRVWAVLGLSYLFAVAGAVVVPAGPFARILPVVLPVFALVFIGVGSGRIATLLSVVTILFVPFLWKVPLLVRPFWSGPIHPVGSVGLMMTQGLALVGMLLGLMFMLERFHHFLHRTLEANVLATAEIERKARESTEAYQRLAREVEERLWLAHELTRIGDEERRRLGQEMHDGVCQQITALLLRCQALERQQDKDGASAVHVDWASLVGLLEETLDETHSVVKGLCPLEPHPRALATALRRMVKRIHDIPCEYATRGDVSVGNPVVAQHLYRIAQEALSNAARHSGARRIRVELIGTKSEVVLRVEDDGKGLPEQVGGDGLGLHTMPYRAHIIGGEFHIESGQGQGTRLTCRVPRQAESLSHSEAVDVNHE